MEVPTSHALVQSDHGPHEVVVQSSGQAVRPHATLSLRASQSLPPLDAPEVWVRARIFVPLPHDFVQSPQVDHMESSQSDGHGCVAQGLDSTMVSAGQVLPPHLASEILVRRFDDVPPPHVLVQISHEPKSDTTQLIGQACLLHWRCS